MVIFIPLGMLASIFQIVILREFSFSIAKNELTFIVAAGFWIASCSLGSIVKIPPKFHKTILPLAFSLVFIFSTALIHIFRTLIGIKYYDSLNLGIALLLSIVLIGPTAFMIGLAFKIFAKEETEKSKEENIYAKFFALEAIGFCIGGLIFTFLFSDYANPMIFALLPLILLPNINKSNTRHISAAILVLLTIVSASYFNRILQKEFDDSKLLFNLGSRYGPVIGIRKAGVTTIFSGGSLLASSEDKESTENFIHMSLSAYGSLQKKKVLFIGAALSEQVAEILKYSPTSIDLLQINPLISRIARKKTRVENETRVNFITGDPRIYLKSAKEKYSAILMNLPPPSNIAVNRYFTEEFFRLVSASLKPDGIFSFSIPSKREILSPQFAKFDSSIINAVKKSFLNQLLIPSDSMVIISSNKRKLIDSELLDNFDRIKPETSFFTIYHFKDYLSPSMRGYILKILDKNAPPNSDLKPSGFLNYLILEQNKYLPRLNIESFRIRKAIIITLLLLGLLIIIISHLSRKSSALLNVGIVGYSSIGINSVIFVIFQSYCGALFWKFGILIALFMAGLSAGAFSINKIRIRKQLTLSFLYTCWAFAILALFLSLRGIGKTDYAEFILYLYFLICGFLTGGAYPLLAQNLLLNNFKGSSVAVAIYSADLIGAFLGTLACGIFLIPFLGIPSTLLSILFLNVIFILKNLRN